MASSTSHQLAHAQEDYHTFIHRFNTRLRNTTRHITNPQIGEDKLKKCLKVLESLERQVTRVRGKLIPEAKCDILQQTLSDLVQQSRSIAGLPAVYTCHKPVLVKRTNGNAKYVIPKEQLQQMLTTKMTVKRISQELQVSVGTIEKRMKEYGLSSQNLKFVQISDDNLDIITKEEIGINRAIGANALHVRLRINRDVSVPRQRVRDSVLRVDPVGVALRALKPKLERRVYSTPAPNSVWHMDGNHKFIKWGIVIHGGVDGYSRLCTFCAAATDNMSTTVVSRMARAVAHYGLPQQISIDQGGENNLASLMMELLRGSENRPSFRVSSNHNERIERLWNDVWRVATNPYKQTFYFMEEHGFLDRSSDLDISVLQYVYLPRLNRSLESFRHEWNGHKLRTEHHQTPEQLFQIGMIRNANSQLPAVRDFFDNDGLPQNSSTTLNLDVITGKTNVVVKQTPSPLTESEHLHLRLHIDPLAHSDIEGVDIFLRAKLALVKMRPPPS